MRDFGHIGLRVTFPLALVVPASSPAANLKALVEQARAKPGMLHYGSQGINRSYVDFAVLRIPQQGRSEPV